MRISIKNLLALAVVSSALGCGLEPTMSTEPLSAEESVLPNLGLHACSDVIARPEGVVALEDIPGTVRLVVHVGDVAVCAGTLEEIERAGLLRRTSTPFGPFGPINPSHRLNSDPMPADGRHDANSDPMPANGSLGSSDPMPAADPHRAITKSRSKSTGSPIDL